MFHTLCSVCALPDLTLLVHFVGGPAKSYDMKPLLAAIPAFQDLARIPGLFEQVKVDAGGYGVSWNDDLDLSCDELWEHGTVVSTPFDGLISFRDATALWGLNESTLRKAVAYRKLIDGVDVKKFGKQWIVTLDAMKREYGEPAAQL